MRYRGYFYDTETSLYYLKSRYYDPEVGRFINPDAYASTGQGILGANMFAYCNNSPVVLTDATGSLSELGSKILGVAFGVFCGAVAAAVVISVAPAAVCALSVGLTSWGGKLGSCRNDCRGSHICSWRKCRCLWCGFGIFCCYW